MSLGALLCACAVQTQDITMLVGSYTNGSDIGLRAYTFHPKQLTATLQSETVLANASFFAVTEDTRFVYTVSENGPRSAVVAFSFDKESGVLTKLNERFIPNAGPCYICVDERHRLIVTANYGNGTISVFPIAKDGSLGGESIQGVSEELQNDCPETYTFSGSGADSTRQRASHLHCVRIAPDGNTLFASNLGTDKMYYAAIQDAAPHFSIKTVKVAPGSGPRHIEFTRDGAFVYLINELSGHVTVFSNRQGEVKEIQSALADTCYARGSADIHLSPDERFLYVSTRLQGDGIVVFKVGQDGLITRIGYTKTGVHPRNFTITPDGKLMLVACRDSGVIQLFKIDKASGLLTDTGATIAVNQPVCVKLVE